MAFLDRYSHLLAVPDSKRSHPTLRGRLSACRSDVDQIAVNQRRHADEIAFLRIGDLLGPKRMPVLGVERQQKAIIGTADDLSVSERRAAMRVQRFVLAWRPRARPDLVAISAIDRNGIVGGREVHPARRHDRSGLRWLFVGE